MLTAVGLEELIAGEADGYVAAAAGLARNTERLISIRSTLRGHMRASALCDAEAFARAMEQAYHGIWHRWCVAQAEPRRALVRQPARPFEAYSKPAVAVEVRNALDG